MVAHQHKEPEHGVFIPEAETINRSRARVLLADDDEINRQIVMHILTENRGFALTVAVDGREALQACLTSRFDLLIIDYKMPGISGDRLVRFMRSSPNPNLATPVILFSAATRQELGQVAISGNVDAIISKPVNATDFLSSVRELLPVRCVS